MYCSQTLKFTRARVTMRVLQHSKTWNWQDIDRRLECARTEKLPACRKFVFYIGGRDRGSKDIALVLVVSSESVTAVGDGTARGPAGRGGGCVRRHRRDGVVVGRVRREY